MRQPFIYTISIENLGPTWASLELVDTLPSGVKVEAVDAGDSSCEVSRDEVVCRIFGIPDGGSETVRITVSARKPATLTQIVHRCMGGGREHVFKCSPRGLNP